MRKKIKWPDFDQMWDPYNKYEHRARAFHKENPIVWELFAKKCLEAASAKPGWTLAARMTWESMRWEYTYHTTESRINPDTGEPLKLDNNHSPYYARWFNHLYPNCKSKFVFRRVIGEPKGEHDEEPEDPQGDLF